MRLTKSYHLNVTHQIPEKYVGSECSRRHGHEIKVEVTIADSLSPASGLLIARSELDRVVEDYILKPFQSAYVNDIISPATGEAMASEFLRRLQTSELGEKVKAVQVVETRKNRFYSFSPDS